VAAGPGASEKRSYGDSAELATLPYRPDEELSRGRQYTLLLS